MNLRGSALLTDLYQLTMLHAYYVHDMNDTAVFELFVRRLPLSAISWWPPASNRHFST